MNYDEAKRRLERMKSDAEEIIHVLGKQAEQLWEQATKAETDEAAAPLSAESRRITRLVNYAHGVDSALPSMFP